MKMIDAHIHLDHYKEEDIIHVMENSHLIEGLITVSSNLVSCKRNLELSRKYQKVKPAFGYHPEQRLPTRDEQTELFRWMDTHLNEMIAIGEVGLPYYLKREEKVSTEQFGQYIELLENFIQLAKEWERPIVLHAVYEDAEIVCELLEKYSLKNAHFHWFKGNLKTIARMKENRYFISITPEVVYKNNIQQLVQNYPLDLMMIETDGPWTFEGPFLGKITNPNMMSESIRMIAKMKKLSIAEVSARLLQNTESFYRLKPL